jgi:hypothetical protein
MNTVALLLLALAVPAGFYFLRSRQAARRAYIHGYTFPKGLGERFLKRRPELTAEQTALVFDGLRQYFEICQEAGRRMAAMPSQAVDDLWHEFILYTRNYQAFCDRAFGRSLHHTPADAMSGPTAQSDSLRLSWRLACGLEGIDPKQPGRLPLLFAIDRQLNLADGFHYLPDCSQSRNPDGSRATHCGADLGSGGGDGGGSYSDGDGGCGGDGGGGGCGGGGD